MAVNPNTQFSSGAVYTADEANRFPRGVMAFGTSTATTTPGAVESTQITASAFTAVANRYYRITYYEHENAGNTHRFIRRRMDMDMGMTFNPSKAAIALVGLICMTVLIAIGAIQQDQGLPIITMIIGYAVGNGIQALSNKQVEPIIRKKDPK
jgi:hypothetical protein